MIFRHQLFYIAGGKGGVLGWDIFEKKIPCLLKKYFISLSVQEFVFEVWIAPFGLMSLSAWLTFFIHLMCEKKINSKLFRMDNTKNVTIIKV